MPMPVLLFTMRLPDAVEKADIEAVRCPFALDSNPMLLPVHDRVVALTTNPG
jgi:hypothetical protein